MNRRDLFAAAVGGLFSMTFGKAEAQRYSPPPPPPPRYYSPPPPPPPRYYSPPPPPPPRPQNYSSTPQRSYSGSAQSRPGSQGTARASPAQSTSKSGAGGAKSGSAKAQGNTSATRAQTKPAATSKGTAPKSSTQQRTSTTRSSVDNPFRPDLKGKAKNDFNNPSGGKKVDNKKPGDEKKKGPRGPQDCLPGEKWDPQLQKCVPATPTRDFKPK